MNLFDFRNDPTGGFSILVDILPAMAKKLYKIPQVMDLYHKRKTFDLIIVDQLMNEVKRFDFVVHCVILVHET